MKQAEKNPLIPKQVPIILFVNGSLNPALQSPLFVCHLNDRIIPFHFFRIY